MRQIKWKLGWLFLGLLVGTQADGAPKSSQANLPDQILVLKTENPKTSLKIRHVPGDKVARLFVKNPAADLLEVLNRQTGVYLLKAEHQIHAHSTQEILLRLSTDAVRIKVDRLKRPRGYTIALISSPKLPLPAPGRLLGHIPGIFTRPKVPVLFPSYARDTPCTGHRVAEDILAHDKDVFNTKEQLERRVADLIEPICRSYVISRLAAKAMERSLPVNAFERWAFNFAEDGNIWQRNRDSNTYASLVAAEVLSRKGYFPEAETLLTSKARFRRKSFASYHALAFANSLQFRGRFNEAETLYAQLVKKEFHASTIYYASLGRALNALNGEDPTGALIHAETALKLLPNYELFPGSLWIVGGEAALALGWLDLSQKHYRRAAKSNSVADRGIAELRLGDLEARRHQSSKWKKKAHAHYNSAQKAGGECFRELLHFRRTILDTRNRDKVLRFVKAAKSQSICEAERLEALFAISMAHLYANEDDDALAPAESLLETGQSKWGSAEPHKALITAISASIIDRMVRHQNWYAIAELYEKRLYQHKAQMTHKSVYWTGVAYDKVGLHQRGADLLLQLLTEKPRLRFKTDLIIALTTALLRQKDEYRGGLVCKYYFTRHSKAPKQWKMRQLAAEFDLMRNRPQEALKHLRKAASAPKGDARILNAFLRADAHARLEKANLAASELSWIMRQRHHLDIDTRGLGVRIFSLCARKCGKKVLNRLLASSPRDMHQNLVTDRVKYLMEKRGIASASIEDSPDKKKGDTSLWDRLRKADQVTPESPKKSLPN